MEWLNLPEPALIAFLNMKLAIEARESMRRGDEVAYGVARAFGAHGLADAIWQEWERVAMAANIQEAQPQQPVRTAKDDRNAFIAMMRGSGLQRKR